MNIQFSLTYLFGYTFSLTNNFHFVSLVLKYAYTITAPSDHPTVDIYSHLTWNEVVPLKMNVFVWRLLNKRILTKNNLSNRRRMVPSSSLLCSRGCRKDETINYLLLGCDYFGSVWNLVLRWMGGYLDVEEHVLQFGGALLFRKKACHCL